MRFIVRSLKRKPPMPNYVYRWIVQAPNQWSTSYQWCSPTNTALTSSGCDLKTINRRWPKSLKATISKEKAAPIIVETSIASGSRALLYTSAQIVGTVNSENWTDKNGLVIRATPIDGTFQVPLPQALWEHFLYHVSHHVMTGNPGQCRMYDSIHREFF